MRLKLRDLAADRCERRPHLTRRSRQAAGFHHSEEGRHRFQPIHRTPLPKSGRKGLNSAMLPQFSEDRFRDFLGKPLNSGGEWLDGRYGRRDAPGGWMSVATSRSCGYSLAASPAITPTRSTSGRFWLILFLPSNRATGIRTPTIPRNCAEI